MRQNDLLPLDQMTSILSNTPETLDDSGNENIKDSIRKIDHPLIPSFLVSKFPLKAYFSNRILDDFISGVIQYFLSIR